MKGRWKSTEPATVFGLLLSLLLAASANAAEPGASQNAGQTLYGQLCASCHGAQGRGDGVVSDDLLLRRPE